MEYKQLGNSALNVSRLSLGGMSFHTEEQARPIIHEALDLGINYFDTADLYDKGENERIIGKLLKEQRQHIILATKVGNQWREDGSGWDWNPSKTYIKAAVKESLKRLQTDYIDLYQLHGGTIDDPIDETIEAFEELRQEGWIRAYGISSIRHNVIREYVQRSKIISNMMQYSLFDRRPEEFALDHLANHSVGVLVRGGIAKGLLANKAARAYLGHEISVVKEVQDLLDGQLSGEQQRGHLALAYCWQHPAVASIVIGASSAEQLRQNAEAIKHQPLDLRLYQELQANTPRWQYEKHR
ncbi:MAG: aldo/keto reductase [Saprospiraceae bacterium]|nr:aldo/keto reductase [Saprospiraceae bacterium]